MMLEQLNATRSAEMQKLVDLINPIHDNPAETWQNHVGAFRQELDELRNRIKLQTEGGRIVNSGNTYQVQRGYIRRKK